MTSCRASTLLFLAIAAIHAYGQDPTPKDEAYYDAFGQRGGGFGRGANQVTISPDGSKISWLGPPLTGRGANGIWIMPVAGGEIG